LILYLLLSGHLLGLGLGLAMLGVVIAKRWAWSAALVWSGITSAVLSAVPWHPLLYVGVVVTGTIWHRCRHGKHARTGNVAFLAVLTVAFAFEYAPGFGGRVPPPSEAVICVLGDSISAGLTGSPNGTWPALLAQTTGRKIVNLAHAGATLTNGLGQARAIPAGPTIVLVELGGNDLLSGTTTERFAADLRLLLSSVATSDHHVWMFELPLLPFQNAYGRVQRAACQEHGVVLIPRSVLAAALGHTTDGLHLSGEGQAQLANDVRRALWEKE
jgi:lysophospholipase L1-like esterase